MPCAFAPGPLSGLMIIRPKIFADERGWFLESYKRSEFAENGIDEDFVQDNHSRSVKNVIRGLHFQRSPKAQGKLVRCTRGTVWDVAVDLRRKSPTFGRHFTLELSAGEGTMLYIPPGCAHGFAVLSDTAEVQYKCTAEYAPRLDGGVRFDDPFFAIPWPLDLSAAVVSEKDRFLPAFAELGEGFSL